MTRWIGLMMLLGAAPLFFAARRSAVWRWPARSRQLTMGGVFVTGVLGLFLALFGGWEQAAAALVLWVFAAWAYNL